MKTVLKNSGLLLVLAGALFTACEKPDDFVNKGFDVDLFSKNLKASSEGQTVGYGFAIAQNGKIVKYGSGGHARKAIDAPETDYLITTRQATGSCTKTITALAVLKAMEDKSRNENSFLWELLPPSWNIPAVNRQIRVSHLLSHKSGLTYFGDSYAALRQTMQTPTTGFGDEQKFYAYNNVNFLMCRVLLPCVVSGTAAFEGQSDEAADEAVSQLYRAYVREKIFKTAGLPDYSKINIGPWNDAGPITLKNPDRQMTLYYNYSLPQLNGMMKYTTYLESGAGGWYMNAAEVVQVMLTAEAHKIVSSGMLTRMKEKLMGFDNIVPGKHGNYYWKNGIWGDPQVRGIYTVIMHFPNNVQVVWHTNSRQTNIGDPENVIAKAYDDAWR
ncbi:serine hydrolase domain-containing protein [Chitinophaga sp. GCM10012297]|uniref:Serine hydrolase n=1 Tax=Chitinophaga chungangae TaxID=2821488 RepID=A0ABS3Y864_9BACT|nr:serine hydrolase domain-containing protein [Chitinophaga chungangae]MBO9150821.1 serine hydrolase [Chitinophaga chungangae]